MTDRRAEFEEHRETDDRRRARRRSSDRRFHFLRENWYRDVWLFVISVIVALVAWHVLGIANDLVSTRKTAVADSCRADNVQADVLRTILDTSLDQQRRMEKAHQVPPGSITAHDAEILLDKLLAPLGGFHPTPEQKNAICKRRVDRGSPP